MAAPALVALAHGSRDPRSAATIRALVDEVRAVRPDLKVEPAFLELSRPGFQTVVDRLVKAGHDEIVVVPLLLTEAHHATVDVPAAVAEATERHPEVRIQATGVLGLENCFLQVLDERLREALREARVRELDALVLADLNLALRVTLELESATYQATSVVLIALVTLELETVHAGLALPAHVEVTPAHLQ